MATDPSLPDAAPGETGKSTPRPGSQRDMRKQLAGPSGRDVHLRLRKQLIDALRDVIRRRGFRQQDAAALFGVTQPRVSDLVRGKIALFSIDTLVEMLTAAGVAVDIRLHEAPRPEKQEADRKLDRPHRVHRESSARKSRGPRRSRG
jgi:predicted XRE-type DNA-binding protein